jgi:tRNA (cmo5U34)-methyltransferase
MARHFDSEGARKYDHRIRKVMPGYEVLHGLARSLLRLDLKERAHLLIVGAGTGMEVVHLGPVLGSVSFAAVNIMREWLRAILSGLV